VSARGQREPPPEFAARFRQHVLPRLVVRLPAAALDVVSGYSSYGDAWDLLWWFSWRRGGSFLSADLALDVEQWLHRRLLEEIDRAESEIEQESNALCVRQMEMSNE
jgi:hypothetical protein